MMSAQPTPKVPLPEAEVADAFRSAMSLLAGGVTVVTSGRGDHRRGLTATAVCSLSMSPPMILACVNCSGAAHEAIEREGVFAINILAQDGQAISDLFAGRGDERGAEKFKVGAWGERSTGAPVLEDALFPVDCEVAFAIRRKTHTIFIGRVRDVLLGAKRPPLVHYDRRYCSVAMG
jgi:flavin reductase (DIM6/NTAB) family NADH-FMN oxidoreductase RutF